VAASLLSCREDTLDREPLVCRSGDVLVGRVSGALDAVPSELVEFECRNHRLAQAALLPILPLLRERVERLGATRVAVVAGSSTSGVDASEAAYGQWKTQGSTPPGYHYQKQHEMGATSEFVARLVGARGPRWTVSTACSSGAKVLASARSLLALGLADAVVVGGVDTICHITLEGFDSLQSLSRGRSTPFSAERDGLNIGEGAAFFLMERGEDGPVVLSGVGESCDAHHMNAPHPQGLGAEAALRAALSDAGIAPGDVDYVNLHGTGTQLNDAMESLAMSRVFPDGVPCSSTKPFTGHCLGAAGAVEAAICWIGLSGSGSEPVVPSQIRRAPLDPQLPSLKLVDDPRQAVGRKYWVSSSFAFGGNNCCLVLEGCP
jgi:3-oxoacyl-[acyl-carrier-protein] synthase-1